MSTNNSVYDAISRIIRELGEDFDIEGVLPAICEIIDSSIDTNMQVGGRWDGNEGDIGIFSGGNQKWKPLAKSTQENYRRAGISNLARTLDRNAGGLRSSIEVRPFGSHAVSVTAGNGSKKGTSPKVYAGIHNFGGTINMPPQTRKMKFKFVKAGKVVFAKKKARGKGVYEKEVSIPAYTIQIPPSPYLVLQEEDLEDIYDLLVAEFYEA